VLIQRYLARRLLAPALGVFVFSIVVVAVFYLAQLLNQAALDGWPLGVVLGMAGLRLVLYFDVLIPVSLLIGLVVGLGRVQQSHELTALASAGIGKARLVGMVAGWIALLALLVAVLSMVVRPWGYSKFYEIEAGLAERLDVATIEPGRFQVGDETWLIYAQGSNGTTLQDVFVHQKRPRGRGVLTAQQMTQVAESDGLVRLQFRGAVSSYLLSFEGEEMPQELASQFESLDVLVEPQLPSVRQKVRRALSVQQLFGSSRPIEIAELQWRFVTPISVVLLACMGFVLSSSKPRVQRAAFVFAALVVATLYFSLLGVVVNWVELGRLAPSPGVFLAPLVTAGLLVVWATTGVLAKRVRR